MSDTTDDNTPRNVIDFGRRTGRTGFTISPPSAPSGGGVAGPVIPPQPDGEPANGTRTAGSRRSPLGALAALPSIALTTAPVVVTHPDSGLPDTFRGPSSSDGAGPRLGALSLAATLAVAVAALRGSCILLEDWRQRRLAKAAESAPLREARAKHKLALAQARFSAAETAAKHAAPAQGGAGGATQRRSKRTVPDGPTFGQKTLGTRTNRTGNSGASGAGSKGGGRGSGADHRSTGLERKHQKTGPGHGGGVGSGRGHGGAHGQKHGGKHNSGTGRHHKTDGGRTKSPHRASQGGGPAVKSKDRDGRTRLPKALKDTASRAAYKRLEKRRKDPDHPVLWRRPTKDKDTGPDGAKTRSGTDKTKTPKEKKAKREPDMSKLRDAFWHDAKARAGARWSRRSAERGVPPLWKSDKQRRQRERKAQEAKASTPKTGKREGERWRRARDRARAAWARRPAGAAPGPAGAAGNPRGRQGRRSPFENAGRAGTTTVTVERDNYPGARADRREPAALDQGMPALPPAPEPHHPRPGTTRPKEPIPMPPAPVPPSQDPRLAKARKMAARRGQAVIRQARHMDAQHATEINLDDAIDEYGHFTSDGFKTHEQAAKLSARAANLRSVLEVFAEQLARENNLIGALFTGTMANLAEDMDLLDRMAEEMAASSLEAAEEAETADNELNDAYRPISNATADAGLTTPSAPVHNHT
jgi:hypothetical protein